MKSVIKYCHCLIFLICFLTCFHSAQAQRDTEHFIPPFYGKGDMGGSGVLSIYLSTLETSSFDVNFYDCEGNVVHTVPSLSATNPHVWEVESLNNVASSRLVVTYENLGKNLRSKGLRAVADKPFYVNLRYKVGSQGASLTTKGTVAKGNSFYTGHMFSMRSIREKSNGTLDPYEKYNSQFFSIMATENNTTIKIDNPRIKWLVSSTSDFSMDNVGKGASIKLLQKGETLTFGIDNKEFDGRKTSNWNNSLPWEKGNIPWESSKDDRKTNTRNLVNGTHIESNRPIVVNSGTWNGSPTTMGGRDIGFDQLTPTEVLGQEYIVMRGAGSTDADTERSIIIATEDNTEVEICSPRSNNTIVIPHAGEYFITHIRDYKKIGSNRVSALCIKATKPICVMQTAQGQSSKSQTTGMSFIPPLKCNSDREVLIPYPNRLKNNGKVAASIKIIANDFNSDIELKYGHDSDATILLTSRESIDGNNDWFAYSVPNISSGKNVNYTTIESNTAINVGLYAVSGNIGAAGFYSGFGERPTLDMTPEIGEVGSCSGQVKLTAETASNHTEFKWYRNGELLLDESGVEISTKVITANKAGYYKALAIVACNGNEVTSYPSDEIYVPPCVFWGSTTYTTQENISEGTFKMEIELSEAVVDDVFFDVELVADTDHPSGTEGYAINGTQGDFLLNDSDLKGLTIDAGSSSLEFEVKINQDVINEPDEQFTLKLVNIKNATGSDINSTVTIEDDSDSEPKLLAQYVRSEHNDGINEDGSEGKSIFVDLLLSKQSGYDSHVQVDFTDVTAEQSKDWEFIGTKNQIINFLAGEQRKTIFFKVLDDNLYEDNAAGYEEAKLVFNYNDEHHLSSESDTEFSIRIIDEELKPELKPQATNRLTVIEGNDIQLRYVLHGKTQETQTFQYRILDGSGANGAVRGSTFDYNYSTPAGAENGGWVNVTLSSDVQDPTFSIDIPTNTDSETEGLEEFYIEFRTVTGSNIIVPSGQVVATIVDSDTDPQVSIQSFAKIEEDVGTSNIIVTVAPVPTANAINLAITWTYGTANASDVGTLPSTAIISSGSTSINIPTPVIDDKLEEQIETLTATISVTSGNAEIKQASCEIQIIDNDKKVVARDDFYSCLEDSPTNSFITVLDNDDLGDADVVTNLLNFQKLTDPAHGTLVFNNDGTFSYEPDADFSGTDSFTYQFWDNDASIPLNTTDPDDYSGVATVTIEVIGVDDLPYAFNDEYTTTESTAITVALNDGVLLNDENVENIIITWGQPKHGTLVGNADGTFTYTPNTEFFSSASMKQDPDVFTYTVSVNGKPWQKSEARVTINVTYVNDHPPVGTDANISTNRGTTVTYDLRDCVSDEDGNVTIDWSTVQLSTLNSENGTISVANGILTYTAPDKLITATDDVFVTYKVSDEIDDSRTQNTSAEKKIKITVTENNERPVANCKSGVKPELSDSGEVSITASQINNGSSDANQDDSTLDLSINSTAGVKQTDGAIKFSCSDLGKQTVVLKVTDDKGASSTCEAIVTIVDLIAPTVKTTPTDIKLCTGNDKVVVNYSSPGTADFNDNCGVESVSLKTGPATGDEFSAPATDEASPKTTTISFQAKDKSDNVSTSNYNFNVEVYRLTVTLEVDGSNSVCEGDGAVLKASVSNAIGTNVSLQLMKGEHEIGATQSHAPKFDLTCSASWTLTSSEHLASAGTYKYKVVVRANNLYDGTSYSGGDDTADDGSAVTTSSEVALKVNAIPVITPFTSN